MLALNNLKKFIILFFIFLFLILTLDSVESEDVFIKRTVLIISFFNETGLKEYNYLESTLTKALKANLINSNQFYLSNPVDLEKKIIELNFNYDDLKKPINAIKLGELTNSDIIIIANYIIEDDNILIQMEAIDVFTGEIVAMTQKKSRLGFNLLDLIDEFSIDMTEKMIKNFPLLQEKKYKELINKKNKIKTINFLSYPSKKTAISLTVTGGSFLLIGLPILIYNFSGYYQVYKEKKDNYYATSKGYDDLLNSYYIFISFFISSIISSSIGIILLFTSIPFYIIKFKTKNKNISLSLEINNGIKLSFIYFINYTN